MSAHGRSGPASSGRASRLPWLRTGAARFGLGALLVGVTLAFAGSAGAAVNFGKVTQFRIPAGTGLPQLPTSIVSGKFNGDADPDLVVAGPEEVRIFLGAKKGAFKLVKKPALTGGFDFIQVVAAPLDSDSRSDLIVTDGEELTMLLNTGNGRFSVADTIELPGFGNAVRGMGVGDLNGDGDTDLAAAGIDGVRTYFGDGGGRLAPGPIYDSQAGADGVVVANLDAGPSLDIGVATGEVVYSLLNDGTGAFLPSPVVQYGNSSFIHGFDVGDQNGDTIADLVVGTMRGTGQLVTHPLLGDGAGGFAEQASVRVPFGRSAGLSPDAIRLVDIDLDGELDLLASNEDLDAGSFAVLLGDGAGGFKPRTAFAADKGPSGLVSDDFNGDGRPDVATANYFNGISVSTFLARGGQVKCKGKRANFVGFPASEVSAEKGKRKLRDAPFGNSDDDVLSTGGGDDFARGAGGDDRICGGGGDDSIVGAKGSDVLFGGAGDDTINGGSGNDRCIGGPGKDKFRNCEKIRR